MTEAAKPPAPSAMVGRWRDRLLDTAVLGIPTALLTQSITWAQGKFFGQPWQILWIALPLSIAAFATWKLLRRPTAARITWRFGLFLVAYASLFAVLSASNLLVWKRVPLAEFEQGGSRNWLLPIRLGDWRYWIARKEPPAAPLTVILLDHLEGADKTRNRVRDAQLIESAIAQKVKGIFFDVSFSGTSPADAVFCAAVRSASAAGIPVATAYQILPVPDSSFSVAQPPAIAGQTPDCLLPTADGQGARGHSMVLEDVDGIIRTVPLQWSATTDDVPLAVLIAQCIASKCANRDLKLPDTKLLYFLPTSEDPQRIAGDRELARLLMQPNLLTNRFLLVGERSRADTFATPMNAQTPGTMIHAYVVNGLLDGHFITRPPAWLSAFVVIAACAILALFGSQQATIRTLLLVAGGVSVTVIALAAAAMVLFTFWLDVIYAVVAIWLLVPLLVAYRRLPEKL